MLPWRMVAAFNVNLILWVVLGLLSKNSHIPRCFSPGLWKQKPLWPILGGHAFLTMTFSKFDKIDPCIGICLRWDKWECAHQPLITFLKVKFMVRERMVAASVDLLKMFGAWLPLYTNSKAGQATKGAKWGAAPGIEKDKAVNRNFFHACNTYLDSYFNWGHHQMCTVLCPVVHNMATK